MSSSSVDDCRQVCPAAAAALERASSRWLMPASGRRNLWKRRYGITRAAQHHVVLH